MTVRKTLVKNCLRITGPLLCITTIIGSKCFKQLRRYRRSGHSLGGYEPCDLEDSGQDFSRGTPARNHSQLHKVSLQRFSWVRLSQDGYHSPPPPPTPPIFFTPNFFYKEGRGMKQPQLNLAQRIIQQRKTYSSQSACYINIDSYAHTSLYKMQIEPKRPKNSKSVRQTDHTISPLISIR